MTDQYEPVFGTSAPSRFQILSLDGGGVKALFTAHVLARLENDLQTNIRDRFDLIAGTSAGGIIALALGAGLRPAEIFNHYTDLAVAVFPASRRRWWHGPRRLRRPTYEQEPLRRALTDVLGERLLGQSDKRLIIPSWDVHNGCVHVFKTPHHARLRRDWRIPMVDVGLATSAAPVYLPAASVDHHRLVDGGVWANNPSVVAIAEARSVLGVDLDAIRVLNVGTTSEVPDHPRRLDHGGYVTWARHAVSLVLTATSRGAQGIAEHLVGRSNYHRFDVMVPGRRYMLDDADPVDLASHAAAASRLLAPTFAGQFEDHQAAGYTPLVSGPVDERGATTAI